MKQLHPETRRVHMHLARDSHLFTVLKINHTHNRFKPFDSHTRPKCWMPDNQTNSTEFVIGSVHRSTHDILPEPGPIFQDHGCEWSLCCRQTNARLVREWVRQDCGGVLWDNVCCCFSTSRVVWTDRLCLCAFRGCLLGTSQPPWTIDCQLCKLITSATD